MMCSTIVITLFAFVPFAHAKELVAKHTHSADKSTGSLVQRTLKAWPFHETDLDTTALKKTFPGKIYGKLCTQTAFAEVHMYKSRGTAYPRPSFSAAHSRIHGLEARFPVLHFASFLPFSPFFSTSCVPTCHASRATSDAPEQSELVQQLEVLDRRMRELAEIARKTEIHAAEIGMRAIELVAAEFRAEPPRATDVIPAKGRTKRQLEKVKNQVELCRLAGLPDPIAGKVETEAEGSKIRAAAQRIQGNATIAIALFASGRLQATAAAQAAALSVKGSASKSVLEAAAAEAKDQTVLVASNAEASAKAQIRAAVRIAASRTASVSHKELLQQLAVFERQVWNLASATKAATVTAAKVGIDASEVVAAADIALIRRAERAVSDETAADAAVAEAAPKIQAVAASIRTAAAVAIASFAAARLHASAAAQVAAISACYNPEGRADKAEEETQKAVKAVTAEAVKFTKNATAEALSAGAASLEKAASQRMSVISGFATDTESRIRAALNSVSDKTSANPSESESQSILKSEFKLASGLAQTRNPKPRPPPTLSA